MMASTESRQWNERAGPALVDVLPPSVEVRLDAGQSREVVVAGIRLWVAWAGEGSLGDVRRVLGDGRPDVVVARRLSLGARAELTAAGVGWVDETGAAEIAIDTIIISRTGRPSAKVDRPARWTPAVVSVAESLLCGTRATVACAKEATGLSTGSVTNALRALNELGLLEATDGRGRLSARRVVDRRALLTAYRGAVAAFEPGVSVQVGVTWRDPVSGLVELGQLWDRAGISWAATSAAAASVVAPYLGTVSTVDVYVDRSTIIGLEAVAAAAGLRPIEGGRLTLRPFPTVAANRLAVIVAGLRVVPWPRIYADLTAAGVRGEEAAEHLWEVIDAG